MLVFCVGVGVCGVIVEFVVFGFWCLVFGIWYLVFGVLFGELGWLVGFGMCCIICLFVVVL